MATLVTDDPNRFTRGLFRRLPDRYDRLAEVLSMGQNRRWRRAMVDRIVAGGPPRPTGGRPRVLDVASGTAGVAIQLADRLDVTVVGVDLSTDMLRQGARNIASQLEGRLPPADRGVGGASASDQSAGGGGSARSAAGATADHAAGATAAETSGSTVVQTSGGTVAGLVAGRAEQLPFPDGAFDGLTFTYLLRYVADVEATMAELARVVRPGAPVSSLDFMVPPSRFWRAWWWGYTRLVLPVAGAATGGAPWFRVGRFLGPNISGHYRRHPVGDIVAAWRAAGFEDVGYRTMSLGGGLVMWGRRTGG